MKLHLDEYELAREYGQERPFEGLTDDQFRQITDRGRTLFRWYKAHPYVHNAISTAVILLVLVADGFVLLGLPGLFLTDGRGQSLGWILLASVCAGLLHGWVAYSLTVFSLHEAAAHNLAFTGNGPFARTGQFVARNLCRLMGSEPVYYAACHNAHHARFGTVHDSEFLNFVRPRRLWPTFLPLAVFINYSDFIIHRPLNFTRLRLISGLMGLLYHGGYGFISYQWYGWTYTLITFLAFVPHVGFLLDRLRQFTEHNLMPLENRNGARSLGVGFWGLLIGGGPWGQPCHWAHHLVPSIPWYQQILLHRRIRAVLTPRQREQFLIEPFVGYPRVLWRILRDANAFARARGIQPGEAAEPVPE